MTTHLFQFRFADAEQHWLITFAFFSLGRGRDVPGFTCGIVMLEIDIFASSTGEFNIIALDHIKHSAVTRTS